MKNTLLILLMGCICASYSQPEQGFLESKEAYFGLNPPGDSAVIFAGSKGDIGIITGSAIKMIASKIVTDTIIPHFRALSYTKESVYALSVENPALLYQFKNNKLAVVYKEENEKVFYDAMQFFDELNGIAIIHELVETIDVKLLKGRIVAIPGLNAVSVELDQRRFIDDEDLNRNFPGKETGNRSEQYAYKISERVLPVFDFQIDMHTASFGRTNTMYARADASNDTIMALAKLQGADIILNSKGTPSFGSASTSSRTMRAETGLKGTPGITVEYGNPQVYQKEIIIRGLQGIYNSLVYLNMYTGTIEKSKLYSEETNLKKEISPSARTLRFIDNSDSSLSGNETADLEL